MMDNCAPAGPSTSSSSSSSSSVSTTYKKKETGEFIFGTWNVQGLSNKKDKTIFEIQKEDPDVVVLTETNLKQKEEEEEYGNYIHIRSGVNKDKRGSAGVSILIKKCDEIKLLDWEAINERIITAKLNIQGQKLSVIGVYWVTNTRKHEYKNSFAGDFMNVLKDELELEHEIVILGDFNAKVGTSTSDKFKKLEGKCKVKFNENIGPFGDNEVNDNGQTLTFFCYNFELKIQNTFFDHKDEYKYTFDNKKSKSIIDFFITSLKTKMIVHNVVVCPSLDCGSDHKFLKANVSFKTAYESEKGKDNSLDKAFEKLAV